MYAAKALGAVAPPSEFSIGTWRSDISRKSAAELKANRCEGVAWVGRAAGCIGGPVNEMYRSGLLLLSMKVRPDCLAPESSKLSVRPMG